MTFIRLPATLRKATYYFCLALTLLGTTNLLSSAGSVAKAQETAGPLSQIKHLIVIYQENWSFDSLYGSFPGANGLANAGAAVNQVDKNGKPYTTLPQPINSNLKPPGPDPRFPADMPVQPFDISK